ALTKPKVTRPKEEHLQLTVEQTIRNVFGGQVTGAWIEKLDLSGLSVDDAFIQAVREPLEDLFRQEPATQVVILVDILDEALLYDRKPSVVDLLTDAADLPQGVRFILTSRPESGILGALPENQTGPPYMLSEGEGLTHSQEDVQRHVTEILAHDHA